MKVYGETFLTKTRITITSEKRADKSMFMWSDKKNGIYTLSVLGIINGFLSRFGRVMVLDIDDDGIIVGKTITKKWW